MTTVAASFTDRQNGKRSANQLIRPEFTDFTEYARRLAAFNEHEQVVAVRDTAVGLDAIIAIHDTFRGPALGGCRAIEYSSHDAALKYGLVIARQFSAWWTDL